ncbi:hypothetical protein GCM10010965_28800 [Caldalkalibacillus thermarum]|uniref:UDP-4-amino-4, 6-dideoxy-N-acetyl-beta-L-altrosamine N-acetyltransferase n=1 Tax=Caldalkalibacillus thermarum TaxID=296745 RepID=UPI0016648564|nr:UDP-4-amino-4,6-dideoxy-N-acetyl-beta-L-altrosamine N-acetyltransferase [Caldalkalibacillus thermarum]GGK34136.1 hypothetical protein GCM10010965_28800 [Caldalkalibacillus thermarum]
MKCKLRPLTPKELPLILNWRNSERVRKNMVNDHIISMHEHLQWFRKIQNKGSECYLVFYINEKPIGLVCFNKIDDNHRHCMWGFYVGEDNAPKGSGLAMGYMGLNYAFEQIYLNKVYGEVLSYNQISKNFHIKLGFAKEGKFKQHIRKGNRYIDVYRFGLLRKEWRSKRAIIRTELTKKGFNVK